MITGDHLNIAKETARLIGMGVNIHPGEATREGTECRNELIREANGFAQVINMIGMLVVVKVVMMMMMMMIVISMMMMVMMVMIIIMMMMMIMDDDDDDDDVTYFVGVTQRQA